jgi:serine/threonine protein kinase
MLSGNDPHGCQEGATSPEIMATSATQSISEQGPASITTLLNRIADPDAKAAPLPRAVHPTLKRICAKAMEKDPANRYQSASAMLADLEAMLADEIPPTVGPDAPLQPLILWLRRNALSVALGGLVLVGLGALAAGAMQKASQLSLQLKLAEEKIQQVQRLLDEEKARADRLAQELESARPK